jgi:RHS repeat-associated protein
MLVPNPDRTASKYRYGFQGQEKDDEIKGGEGNSLNYTFRMHDPRVGRFFVADPLFRDYAYNSPYAFSQNRVIDGVELEGLEYATIIYKYYYGSTKPVFELSWHNDSQHNTHGSLGQGVAFKTVSYDKYGKSTTSATTMFKRDAGLEGMLDHGFYYGPTQLPTVYLVNNYLLKPIDGTDNAARRHDMGYDAVNAGAENASKSLATIEADKALISACIKISNLGKDGIDPFNGQKIGKVQFQAANAAATYFGFEVLSKMDEVSNFMENNYPNIAHKASGTFNDNESLQSKNYDMFRDIYMHEDKKEGFWKRNDKMWKQDGEGTWIPKSADELKQNK